MKKLLIILFLFSSLIVHGATYYVSTTGNDGAAGTIGFPWLTWIKGFNTAVAGDTTNNITIKGNALYPIDKHYIDYGITLASTGPGTSVFVTNNTADSLVTGVHLAAGYALTRTVIKNNDWTYCLGSSNSGINNDSGTTDHNIEYRGSSAFTTTADRRAIYINGLNTDYDAIVTADQGSDAVHPVAADLMSAYCKADSLIVKRVEGTGGTSGLKFKYKVNND